MYADGWVLGKSRKIKAVNWLHFRSFSCELPLVRLPSAFITRDQMDDLLLQQCLKRFVRSHISRNFFTMFWFSTYSRNFTLLSEQLMMLWIFGLRVICFLSVKFNFVNSSVYCLSSAEFIHLHSSFDDQLSQEPPDSEQKEKILKLHKLNSLKCELKYYIFRLSILCFDLLRMYVHPSPCMTFNFPCISRF